MQPLSNKDLLKLETKMGGQRNLSILIDSLSKIEHFKSAWETPAGGELMSIIIKNMGKITELIIEEKDKEKDRAELRAYRNILTEFSLKIRKLNHGKATIKEKLGE